mgnify:CR=1 FL=1
MLTRQYKALLLLSIWVLPAASFAAEEQQRMLPEAVRQEIVPSEMRQQPSQMQQQGELQAAPVPEPEPDLSANINIEEIHITGRIEDRGLAVTLDFAAETKAPNRRMLLAQGDIVLSQINQAKPADKLDYVRDEEAYYVSWSKPGHYPLNASFVARSRIDVNSQWREVKLQIPAGRVRKIELISDRQDLDVELPGAMRVQRRIEAGQLVITAILGPNQSFIVRWKPQVELAGAKLVLSSQSNTIVDVQASRLLMDSLFDFQIMQGKIETLTFALPDGLSITAVDGANIRTWRVTDPNEGLRNLVIELSRPQETSYRLSINGEAAVGRMPADVTVPVIEPAEGIRASGHLAIGTNSALQLVVSQSSGVTQIDAPAFPRIRMNGPQERLIPEGKAFFYTYAGSRYMLKLSVDDIVPSYDVAERFVTTIKEDDLVVNTELELDVRDAPIRQLDILVGAGMVVASVDGELVEDYQLSGRTDDNKGTTVRVVFSKPLIGRSLIRLQLELGRGPLDQMQLLKALQISGAKTHRGYVVIAAEAGIEIDDPEVQELREVNTASVPLRVAEAQFAYRFRDPNWNLNLTAHRKPAGIRAEVFHLQSIGESVAYGSAVINYIITGSPVDELRFSLPEELENVEFVGSDVRRWSREDGLWIVKLTRKVIGDYNLAVTYTQQHSPSHTILLGALQCRDVQTQTGYVVVTSHLDLKMQTDTPSASDIVGLLPITIDEIPVDYRLLTSSPILAAYKYVTDPHVALLNIDPYRRSGLLPVILDIVTHQTHLAVGSDERVESVTTVRYKVKNTTGQYLSLTMPPQANVWSVFLIEQNESGEVKTRLATSYDTNTGQLLIPLTRKINPNDPATVELEYGQVHQASGFWRKRLDLTAPGCSVPVTYTDWYIIAPNEWAIFPAGGNMQAQSRQAASVGLTPVLQQVGRLWINSMQRLERESVILLWVAGIIALVFIILCAVFFRRWLPNVVLAVFLVALVWAGVAAAIHGRIQQPASLTVLSFIHAVNADPDEAIHVSTELVPAWRRNITKVNIMAISSIIAIAAVVSLIRRRFSLWAVAAVLAAVLYFTAKLPVTWPILKALMTWGAPAALTGWCIFITLKKHCRRASIPVRTGAVPLLLIIGLMSIFSGCSVMGPGTLPAQTSDVQRVDCLLTAGDDNMEVRYNLRILADAPSSVSLLDDSAVLVSSPNPAEFVTIHPENGKHTIIVDKAGVYTIEAIFLAPLSKESGQEHAGRFNLPLPMSLMNTVKLIIPDTNVLIKSPQAIHLSSTVTQNTTTSDAMFEPGRPALFTWMPKERQASQEETHFYARDIALAHMTSGLLEVFHQVRLQIAQGQIDILKLHIADGETVTSVDAPDIGSWRFDPISHEVEVRMIRPATGVYDVTVVTQTASASLPFQVRLKPLIVHDAIEQHSMLGLGADASVYINVDQHPTVMNARDYIRQSAELIAKVKGLSEDQITQAFRFDSADSVITGQVLAVQSELRSREIARFNAEDERLVYNSQWFIEITKAGRFDVVLDIPEGYDIDTLVAEEVSHWDELTDTGKRQVYVHFKRKLTGTIQLNLALSQPITQVPERLTVPRVILEEVLKHTGQLMIGSEQGVRLSIAMRQGVSEINPAELGGSGQDMLAFQLLRPDWQLDLQTELVQPRVVAQTLHIAKITDGLVRHDHFLRYMLYNAGAKTYELSLPDDATGVTITGPGIARREQTSPGHWRVELADKVYDRPYLLRLTYETQYNQADGNVTLTPVQCTDADLQQGHTVVFATDRIELSVESKNTSMRPAEARNIPKYFGAGDLSGAAMCYYSASEDNILAVKAIRHTAAEQIGAEVRRAELSTVITPSGQAIHRVLLTLTVGTRRHLQVMLPDNGVIWSLSVDGQATQPSLRTDAQGKDVLRVPLPQQATGNVILDMVYVAEMSSIRSANGVDHWAGIHDLSGTRFDLPLKNITWQVYLPDGFNYDVLDGTLTLNKNASATQQSTRYNIQSYEQQMYEMNFKNDQVAQQQLELSRQLAEQGRQADARRALSIGYNFSKSNQALNEDIRVDLDNLLKQQAKIGLVNARGRLRQQVSGATDGSSGLIDVEGNITFSQQQAERIENSLGKADSDNLELITQRIIQTQAAAEGSVAQLQISMPYSGKVLYLESPLQVEPDAAMTVKIKAEPQRIRQVDSSIYSGFGLFVVLLVIGSISRFTYRRWNTFQDALASTRHTEQQVVSAEAEPNNSEKPNDQVSSDELI